MKPTTRCLFLLFIGASIYLYSCKKDDDTISRDKSCIEGSGNIVSRNAETAAFSEIELKSYGNVEIYKGEHLTVRISDYNNLISYYKAEIIGNRLVLKTEPDNICLTNSKVTFIITTPNPLNGLYLNGAGNMDIMSEFNNLNQLSIKGSGKINLHANTITDKLDISIYGAGDIIAIGKTTDLSANIYGAGNVYLKNMQATNAVCSISGMGNITVHADSNLDATIKGIGNIEYYGSPNLKTSISGVGYIKCISEN
ncbi:MAG TPA: head GIN domain-containing protein [Bacteroidales bacterium]|nr:head GIN domain-containing protein [Bacteroidales bacterium]